MSQKDIDQSKPDVVGEEFVCDEVKNVFGLELKHVVRILLVADVVYQCT